MESVEVLIVGAGPVGVTLGCELARRGVGFRLVDQATRPFEGSRGKTLQPRTLELMEDLGVIDRVLARGEPTPPIQVFSPNGAVDVETLFGDRVSTPSTPFPRPFTIAQNLTEDALRTRLAEMGGEIHYGTTLIALKQDEAGVVATLETESGLSQIRAAYVVGCDGGRSKVRQLLGIAFEGDTDESRRLYVADVRIDGLGRESWYSFRGPGGMLNLSPLATTDLYQLQASIPPTAPDEIDIEALQNIVTTRSRRDDIRITDMAWMSTWRMNVRLAAKYREGRVFLAGDACHVHSPAGAQGLNTGFQDACNLAWKLAAVLRGAPADLLSSYEEERRPIAAWMLGLTSALEAQAFEKKGFPTDREEGFLQLAINYRDSSLTAEHRRAPGGVVAGDRLPDATGLVAQGQTFRLFELVRGPRPVVIAVGQGWNATLADLRARYPQEALAIVTIAPGGIEDSNGHFAGGLGIDGDALMVVRPDKYIGFAGDHESAGEIVPYLARLLG
ncbi:FAD-dependent monooxygenase [Novosphingobium sp. Rr 2-17]|uniref:FAD-dependent monooxygenase n=1 Tax=Novosphingobium sp. Rr 2-17 TaxID=555793 RepID=UPI0002E0C5A0|nr:FAD-dependent monooxygenase [Novosphingobium sp. Rr 2-17]